MKKNLLVMLALTVVALGMPRGLRAETASEKIDAIVVEAQAAAGSGKLAEAMRGSLIILLDSARSTLGTSDAKDYVASSISLVNDAVAKGGLIESSYANSLLNALNDLSVAL